MKLKPLICLLALGLSVSACARKKSASAPAPRPAAVQKGNFPVGSLPPGTQVSYSSAKVTGPYISITFDDGPHATNTPRLLDMLAARGIKATFFTVGTNVQRYPAIVRRIVAEGHELANHTWTHPRVSGLGDSGIRSELDRSNTALMSVAGVAPRLFRPPYGAITARQKQFIFSEYGYPSILWSVDPEDWKRPGPAVVTNRILSNTRAGGIVLVHDIHAPSIDAMPATLDGLLAKGFRFVTTSQLIGLTNTAPGAPAPLATLYSPGSF